MRPARSSIDRLRDIETAATDCLYLVKAMNFEEFMGMEQTQVLVAHKLQVIGEAANAIRENIQSKSTEIPWPRIVRMRNIVAHEYFRVDYEIVWQIAQNNLEPLLNSVRSLLIELDPSA